MKCFNCNTRNREAALICVSCGASLRAPRAKLYLDRAEADINRANFEQATTNVTQADNEILALTSEDREKYLFNARAFWLQGCIYYSKGMTKEAKAELLLAQSSLERHPGGRALFADVLNKLGNVVYLDGQLDEAIAYYQRSIEVALAIGAFNVTTRAIGNIGNIYVLRNEIETATDFYNQGLTYAERSGDATDLAAAYRPLIWLHRYYGPYSLALNYADRALALREQITNLEVRCTVTAEAAGAYAKYGDLAVAEIYLREAYELVQRTGDRVAEGAVASNLIDLVRAASDPDAWYIQALRSLNSYLSDPLWKSEFALQMAVYYITRKEETYIRRHLQWLKDNWPRLSEAGEEDTLISQAQALLYTALGQWDAAATHFQLLINDPANLTPYELAATLEDYAAMLLNRAQADPDPAVYAEAGDALERAASLYRQLELPRRVVAAETLRDSVRTIPPTDTDTSDWI
jgi:tetratricopeptide (TPR) repeat protein